MVKHAAAKTSAPTKEEKAKKSKLLAAAAVVAADGAAPATTAVEEPAEPIVTEPAAVDGITADEAQEEAEIAALLEEVESSNATVVGNTADELGGSDNEEGGFRVAAAECTEAAAKDETTEATAEPAVGDATENPEDEVGTEAEDSESCPCRESKLFNATQFVSPRMLF